MNWSSFAAAATALLLSPLMVLAQPPRPGDRDGGVPAPRQVGREGDRVRMLEEENAALKKQIERMEEAVRRLQDDRRGPQPPAGEGARRPGTEPERRSGNEPRRPSERRPDDTGRPRPGPMGPPPFARGFGGGAGTFGAPGGFGSTSGLGGVARSGGRTADFPRPSGMRPPQGPSPRELMERLDRIEKQLEAINNSLRRGR